MASFLIVDPEGGGATDAGGVGTVLVTGSVLDAAASTENLFGFTRQSGVS